MLLLKGLNFETIILWYTAKAIIQPDPNLYMFYTIDRCFILYVL